MRNFRFKITFFLIASILILGACEKDDNTDPNKLEAVTEMVAATSYTEWVYYSFSEGKIVNVTNPKTNTNWDIGLMRNNFRTNSGESGNGLGGAFDAGVVDFDTYIVAPEIGYSVDVDIEAFDLNIREYFSTTANTVLGKWGGFTDTMPPDFILTNKVFAVKTADGKYVKMIVQNYYGTEGSGYITLKYAYQEDGSTNLQ